MIISCIAEPIQSKHLLYLSEYSTMNTIVVDIGKVNVNTAKCRVRLFTIIFYISITCIRTHMRHIISLQLCLKSRQTRVFVDSLFRLTILMKEIIESPHKGSVMRKAFHTMTSCFQRETIISQTCIRFTALSLQIHNNQIFTINDKYLE